MFLSLLSGSGFESSCSHFTFRFRACFEQGVPWHSGNYRVWIHSETAYVTWQEHTVWFAYSVLLLFFSSFFLQHSYLSCCLPPVSLGTCSYQCRFLYNAQVIVVNFLACLYRDVGVNYMRETGSVLAQLGVPKTSQVWK